MGAELEKGRNLWAEASGGQIRKGPKPLATFSKWPGNLDFVWTGAFVFHKTSCCSAESIHWSSCCPIGIFESPKCDVNPQPNTRGIGSLVGRTSGNRRSVMHVLAVIFSITYHFSFIFQYIFIRVKWSGREICPLLMYPSTFLLF